MAVVASGGTHKKDDRKGKGQSTAYPKAVRRMRKFEISNSIRFEVGDVCPVQKRTQTHILDDEQLRVVHREAAHRIRNDFKTNGIQDELNSKRTELITIVGYACKVVARNSLQNIGKIIFMAGADTERAELTFYSEDG